MASKRKGRSNAIPSIEESFFGITSEPVATSKPRKRKPRSTNPQERDNAPLRVKKRATSDSVLSSNKQDSSMSNLKIEAFDFFHQMLNQCCGSQVFDVLNTASILKQFTPEVMKTLIYVIAENSKRVSPKVLTEAQTQTQEKSSAEEHQDIEISNITSKARQRRGRNKWQPVPELVQPRLTSPVSNSCSPVSAAVQALMSFARNEDQVKSRGDNEPATVVEVSKQSKDEVKQAEKDPAENAANLSVFENVSLAAISSSPFLRKKSSSLMLHSEVKKSASFPETAGNEKEHKATKTNSPQNTNITFGGTTSPSFPWIKMPSKIEPLIKCEPGKNTDKNLPSISSILAPIGSSFSDLSFQNMHMLSTPAGPSSNPSSATSSESQKNYLPSMGLIVSGLASSSNAQQKLTSGPPLGSHVNSLIDARRSASSSSTLLVSTSISDGALIDTSLKVSPKTVFRKILPKPNKRKHGEDSAIQYQNLMKGTEQDFSSDLNGDLKLQSELGFFMQDSPPTHESVIKNTALLQPDKQEDSSTLLASNFTRDSSDDANALAKPLASVISNIRQQGFVIKGLPPEPLKSIATKAKKPSHSSSGKLEVASALLSMGSPENETKTTGKVVTTFNKEKATFDIKEGSSVQHGDILFTKTGTFQIEDIEIDPKKNKIEKDSYECGKCGRVFTSLVYLARHIKRVCPDMTLRKWKCERCDKAFRHPFGLQQHIFTHTGERPFKCDQCSKAFYSANDLRRHIRTHSGERPYSCSHCKKCFSTTISLKTHTYIHTGERPHKCPHCPKTFATSSKLSRHVVTHSDKRPFACNICVKTFNRSGDLRRHYNNVHNLEHGLLNCDQCNKLFATEKCLDNHKKSHNRSQRNRSTSESFSEPSDGKFSQLVPGNYTIKPDVVDAKDKVTIAYSSLFK